MRFDLTGLTLTGSDVGDFKLIIDTDGDGNFRTGSITEVAASAYAANMLDFNGMSSLVDGAVFTIVSLKEEQYILLTASGTEEVHSHNCTSNDSTSFFNSTAPINETILKTYNNGNTFNPTNIRVNNVGNLTGSQGTFTTAGTYYQTTDGLSSIRVSKRIHSIEAPGSYTVNGGIVVRVYYDPSEHTSMSSDAWPAGLSTGFTGWYKCQKHTAQGVVNNMNPVWLAESYEITPINSGVDQGVDYVEFLLGSFSSIGYMTSTQLEPLPVEVLSFEAEKIENTRNALLSWKTTSLETETQNQSVEYSVNGNDWTSIGSVAPLNKIDGSVEAYSFVHHNIESPVNFYRIKITDVRGESNYTPVRMIKYDQYQSARLSIYPNPANNKITLTGINTAELLNAQINIINSTGQVVLSQSGETLSVDVSKLTRGLYMVYLFDENGTRQKDLFIKE